MRLVILFDMSLNPSFKMTTSFANIARTTASISNILANIFMGFKKFQWLNEYNLNKPKFYLRYADDIPATFDNEQDSLNF